MYVGIYALLTVLAAQGQGNHPIFTVDQRYVDAIYHHGAQSFGRIPEKQLAAVFFRNLGHIRGTKKWPPSQVQIRSAAINAFLEGYHDSLSGRTIELASDNGVVEDLYNEYRDLIEFVVDVRAWPGTDDFGWKIKREAVWSDVLEVRFALEDGNGKAYEPVRVEKLIEDSQVAAHEGGDEIMGYYARYHVVFSQFAQDGRPIASEKSPKLTFVMLRRPGELKAVFDMNDIFKVIGK
jgi:hypothetical protein